MLAILYEPLAYEYMQKAILICSLVGAVCGFLSVFLMLKGWSLMGDALSHSIVPGVALAYIVRGSLIVGAFFSGILASLSMFIVRRRTKLKEDAIIGIVFSSFFAVGLLIISLNPIQVDINTIVLGNVLAISDYDAWQVSLITLACLTVLLLKWKDFVIVFFDDTYAKTLNIPTLSIRALFFVVLSLVTIAALQAVGAFLVIAMLITPGTTAYLLSDRFGIILIISSFLGIFTGFFGAYISYFLDAHSGGLIVCLQTLLFILAFLFAPKYGLLSKKKHLLKS